MISIDSKLYNGLVLLVQLVVLNFLFYITSIPLLSIPLGILYLCRCIINIVEDKKMLDGIRLTKQIWMQFGLVAIVSYFSVYSVYSLLLQSASYVNLLLASFIISFNLIAYILIQLYDTGIMNILRASFMYSIVYFYKSVLLIFLFMFIGMVIWEKVPILFIVGLLSAYFYIFIKLNYNTLLKLDARVIANVK
ncbi:hypothetical protein [Paenibacillus thiaminolyticus]|uniref:DUF624 domain-containing protein n=1 Tax=Paenibacillus thiaminolyticus TaxID=49283 RepID=A0A3A3GL50_PANTH|nr:hypothetical protein [Paenibacillus thiaminolyticus]RJG25261.1 hypothetical protein DQX05_07375 [Paenibacillus thiaminolyticus]